MPLILVGIEVSGVPLPVHPFLYGSWCLLLLQIVGFLSLWHVPKYLDNLTLTYPCLLRGSQLISII